MTVATFAAGLIPAGRRTWHLATRPHVVIGIGLLVAMLYAVVVPLLALVQTTFTWQLADVRLVRDADPGAFTLFHWQRVFAGVISEGTLYRPLVNTVVVGFGVSAVALSIGSLLAWLVMRTDLPGRTLVSGVAIVPFMLPSWAVALAWIVVFKNRRIGGSPGFLEALTGFAPPDWLSYGAVPIILTLALHYYAFAFLLVSAALTSLDGRLEEVAGLLGADRLLVLRRITFPLVLPSLLSALILTFSAAMGTFGTPAFLGSPVGYYTLSTSIYGALRNRLDSDAYVLCLVLIAISVIAIVANQRIIGVRRSYVTIGGKGLVAGRRRLGPWRYPLATVVALFIAVAVFAPLLFLIYQTMLLRPGDYSLSNLTLHFWIGQSDPRIADGIEGILRSDLLWSAAQNSVALAGMTAAITALFGMLIGYAVVKGRGTTISRSVEQLAFLPYLIPSIAFGGIYLVMFARPYGPLPALYGTFALLVIISVAKHLPYASRAGTAAMMQVGRELEEAAFIAGSSWAHRLRRILLPLTGPGLIAGFLLVFVTTMRELSLIVLLVTPATRTLPALTFRYAEQAYKQAGDAIVVLLVAIVIVVEIAVRRLSAGRLAPAAASQ